MTIYVQARFNKILGFVEIFYFFHFLIWSYVKSLFCGGIYLKFSIDKKHKLFREPFIYGTFLPWNNFNTNVVSWKIL